MVIEIRKELNFEDIKDMAWSGAIYTINMIDKYDKGEEFMKLLHEIYTETSEYLPTDTDINDFLWFESDYIFKTLGITDNDEQLEESEVKENENK